MGNGGVPGLRMHGRCSAMDVPGPARHGMGRHIPSGCVVPARVASRIARTSNFHRATALRPRIYFPPGTRVASPTSVLQDAAARAEYGRVAANTSNNEQRFRVTPEKHHGARTPRGEAEGNGTEFASFRALSEHDRQAINAIIQNKDRIKLAQAQLRDDVKTVAERLGMKTSELNRIVRLAMQEQERGNALLHEKALIEVAEQLVS